MTARKVKIFIYPNAPKHEGLCEEFSNVLPFSEVGMKKWAEIVAPQDAELFWCGQLTDRNPLAFDASKFQYLENNERRHIVDVDGDWGGMEYPEWLSRVTITARNALWTKHSMWSVYATPGASMLLFDLLSQPRIFSESLWHGYHFRGRLDWQFGVRAKVFRALQMAGVPYAFNIEQNSFMFPSDTTLGPYTQETQRESMDRYVKEMLDWSMALCPRAGSHFTMRFYEASALGRLPIVFGDNYWLDHDAAVMFRIPSEADDKTIASALRDLKENLSKTNTKELGESARAYFEMHVRRYFNDPTAAFIEWLRSKKIIN